MTEVDATRQTTHPSQVS